MARQIVGDHLKRGDLPSLPADQIVVVHSENTRLFKPDVSDLVESFKADGQLQPCVVRPLADGRVQLVAGYRRWLAATEIAKEQESQGIPPEDRFKITFVVSRMSPSEALDKNIVENDRRRSLSPIEYAHAIRRLRIVHGWNDAEGTEKIAAMFRHPNGKARSTSWVATMENLLTLSEGEQFEVHRHFESKGEEGLSQTVAQVLASVPEQNREQTLADAREASSIRSKSSIPKNASAGNATIKVRDIANAAEKNGAVSNKARTNKDLYEMIDSYFDGSESLRPLHPVTKELLKRIRGFMTRDITENQFDGTLMRIDGCLTEYYDRYAERKKSGKL